MDTNKESIGLERKRNFVIKRYVKKILCSASVFCRLRPQGRPLASNILALLGNVSKFNLATNNLNGSY